MTLAAGAEDGTVGAIRLPPLWDGVMVPAAVDPFAAAVADAPTRTVPGGFYYAADPAALRLAMVLGPEMTLREAIAVVLAVQLGVADSLGALAPPEVAVHFAWPDRMLVNGAACGAFRAACATMDPDAEPDWLVVGAAVPILPAPGDPGHHAERTTLHDEGCGDIDAAAFIESVSRHALVWISRFADEGFAPIGRAWSPKAAHLGQEVTTPEPGRFVGLGDNGAMVLQTADGPRIISLTQMLNDQP